MKKYCLDTNIISFLCDTYNKNEINFFKKENIKNKIKEIGENNIFICDISVIELIIGMNKKYSELNKKYLDNETRKEINKV